MTSCPGPDFPPRTGRPTLVDALEQARLLAERVERTYPQLDPERVAADVCIEDETGRASIIVTLDNTDGECGISNPQLSALGYRLGLRPGAAGDTWADWTSDLEHADLLLTVYMPGQALTRGDRARRLAHQHARALLAVALAASACAGAAVTLAARRTLSP